MSGIYLKGTLPATWLEQGAPHEVKQRPCQPPVKQRDGICQYPMNIPVR